MDYTTEVVNITKIKDGFFLGDEATASNLDVIVQFKITHMINASGGQIINAWETIGIKYLTLNWSEHSNQNLFDPKDEIANRIVYFIDDSTTNGEGLLVHSVRGQNRACLVILIYLIRKFRWTLSKSLEFLTNKKFDVQIPKYFLQQLSFFETRLSKLGQGPKSNGWTDNISPNDPEEIILKNTFLNGLINKPEVKVENYKQFNFNSRKVNWADNNFNRKDLCCTNFVRDLILQKEIKPITSHKLKRPIKPCLKIKSMTITSINDVKKSYNLITSTKLSESTNLQSNLNNYNSYNNSMKEISTSINYNDLPSLNSSNKHSNDLLKNYTNLNMNNLYTSASLKSPQNNEMLNIKSESKSNQMSQSINIESSLKSKENKINISTIKSNENLPLNTNSIGNNNNINTSSNTSYKQITGVNVAPTNFYYNNNNPTNTNGRQNNFKMNQNTDNSKIRSYSVGQDPNKNNPTSESNLVNDPKIIIASKYQNIINNFNNIIIQSTEDLEKFKPADFQNTPQNLVRPNSLIKRDNNNQNILGNYYNNNPYSNVNTSNEYMNININPLRNIIPTKKYESESNQPTLKDIPVSNSQNTLGNPDYLQNLQARLVKDNQKMMQNNFFSSLNKNNSNTLDKMKVIDHNTTVKQKVSYINQGATNFNQSYTPQSGKSLMGSNTINKNNPINNYQPDLIKKNHSIGQNNPSIMNRVTTSSKQGPVKIQTDYDKKPLTPDNYNMASLKLAGHSTIKNTSSSSTPTITANYGTIKRSNSKQRNESNDRPSTAPQKEKDIPSVNANSSIKRLPSPMIKNSNSTNFGIASTLKQNNSRQRVPSPAVSNKNPTITLGTLKTGNKNLKWK